MEQEKTQEELDKEADEVIRQILWEAEQAEEEVKKQEEEITKKVEETGNADLKQELETYKLKIEDMTAKNAALNKAYKDLLDQKTNLETMNDEFTRKMQLISDNPLLQDLMRWMYLQWRDPSAVTNIDATLKQLLKEYSDIDVDTLVGQARGNGARWLAPTDQSSLIGTNQAYKGLFWEGDVVPLW
jgi:vacuolar-type H+-ATPase subunit E/Vma4